MVYSMDCRDLYQERQMSPLASYLIDIALTIILIVGVWMTTQAN